MLLPAISLLLTGFVLGSYLPYFPFFILLTLAVCALLMTLLERRRVLTSQLGLLLYGSLLFGVWWSAFTEPYSSALPVMGVESAEPKQIVGTIVEPVRHAPNRSILILSVARINEHVIASSDQFRIRVTWRQPEKVFSRGDKVRALLKFRQPTGLSNPGGFDYQSWLSRQHIVAVASVTGKGAIRRLKSEAIPLQWWPWHFIDRCREKVRMAALASLNGLAIGMYLGMIVGEQGYLTPEFRESFMATGTIHILSISGSHLGLIAFLSFFFLREGSRRLPTPWLLFLSRTITPTRLAAIGTVFPVTFYAFLAGGEVATVRALIMILACLIAVWLGYGKRVLHILGISAFLIGMGTPQVVWDLSFQLSFVSVLAIALVVDRAHEGDSSQPPGKGIWGERIQRWGIGYVGVTGGITLATIPLVAYYFNQIAWLGLVGNLLVVPLAGFVFVPLGLFSAFGLLLSGGSELPLAPIIQYVLDGMQMLVRGIASLPGAAWHVPSPSILSMGFFYLVLLWAYRSPSHSWRQYAALVGILGILGWWGFGNLVEKAGEPLRVTFLDVGQGDAVVIEMPDGKTALIDAGGRFDSFDMGRAVVGPFLWDRGITRLDAVVGTHPQVDHLGGLPWVLHHFDVGAYWGNGMVREAQFDRKLRETLSEREIQVHVAKAGDLILSSGDCRLEALNPLPSTAGKISGMSVGSGGMLNNQSVVTRLDCGGHSFLFAGDIEKPAMARLEKSGQRIAANILKVPHHGSKSSLSDDWVRAVSAETAVISVGSRNAFGHPAQRVVDAYRANGTEVRRTDQEGAISVRANTSSRYMQIVSLKESHLTKHSVYTSSFSKELQNLSLLWQQLIGVV